MKYSKHLPDSKNSVRQGHAPVKKGLSELGYRRRFFQYQVKVSDNPEEMIFLVEREVRSEPAIPNRLKKSRRR